MLASYKHGDKIRLSPHGRVWIVDTQQRTTILVSAIRLRFYTPTQAKTLQVWPVDDK